VVAHYGTRTNGGAPVWSAEDVKIDLTQAEKGSVTLETALGEAAASALDSWKSYGGNSDYVSYGETDPSAELRFPGKSNAQTLHFYFVRDVVSAQGPILGDGGGGDGVTPAAPAAPVAEIEDESTPLADMILPEGDAEDDVIILDEDTPLADLPQTGATLPAGDRNPASQSSASAILPAAGRKETDNTGAVV
jgi:hypothetical protein